MTNFNSLAYAFEKAGIKTETKDKVSIVEKKKDSVAKDSLLLFALSLQNTRKYYLPSERLALSHGFAEIADPNAYNGRYFVKRDKIWIHDIGALKSKLDVISDSELSSHGYDVEMYYILHPSSKLSNNGNVTPYSSRSDIGGHEENMVYLSDGVYIRESECWF